MKASHEALSLLSRVFEDRLRQRLVDGEPDGESHLSLVLPVSIEEVQILSEVANHRRILLVNAVHGVGAALYKPIGATQLQEMGYPTFLALPTEETPYILSPRSTCLWSNHHTEQVAMTSKSD